MSPNNDDISMNTHQLRPVSLLPYPKASTFNGCALCRNLTSCVRFSAALNFVLAWE
jgi:hypothetical protein